MEKQHTAESLKRMIAELEIKQKEESELLKEQLDITIKNFKPANIIKGLLKEFYSSDNVLDELINTAISVTSGFITKKVVVGKSKNQLLKLLGLALQFGITTVIAKKFKSLKEGINSFIARYFKDKEDEQPNTAEQSAEETWEENKTDKE